MPAKRMRLDPERPVRVCRTSADAYEHLGRYDEARAILEQASAQELGTPSDSCTRYDHCVQRGDEAGMQSAMDGGKGSSFEPIMFLLKGRGNAHWERYRVRGKALAQGVSAAQKAGLKEFAAVIRLLDAFCLAEVGNRGTRPGRWHCRRSPLSDDRDTRVAAADVLARAGDASRSQKLIEELAREFPTDTMLNMVWLPVARATNQIRADQAAQAVDTLEVAAPYEMGSPPNGAVLLADVRARRSVSAFGRRRKGGRRSIRRFWIIAASTPPVRSIRWRGWGWDGPTRCRGTRRKPRRPTRTSLPTGKMPTPMCPS